MDQEKIRAARDAEKQKRKEAADKEFAQSNAKSIADTVKTGSLLSAKASKEVKQAVKDSGEKVASEVEKVQSVLESGQDSVAQAINNLMLATVLTKDPKLAEAADNVANLLSSIADAGDKFDKSSLNLLPVANKELAKTITELSRAVKSKQDRDLAPEFDRVVEALNSLDVQPVVNVPKSEVNVDTTPITDAIKELQKAVKPAKIEIPKVDFKDVIKGLDGVQKTISSLSFPVPNYVLPFKDSSGKAVQATLTAGGELPVSATIDTTGLATTATDTNTAATAVSVDSIDDKTPALGQALAAGSTPVVLTAAQITTLTPPAAITGFSTSAKQDTMIGHLDGVETLLTDIEADTDTLAVVGGGTEATAQRVTIADDSTGVLSVDDNGGSLTVDNAALTELAGAIDTEVQVDVVGALPAGTNNIGDVDIASIAAGDNNIGNVDIASAIPAGTNNIGDVDVASIAAGTNLIGKVGLNDGSQDMVFLPDSTDATGSSATANKLGVASRNFAWGSAAAAWHRQRTMENAADSTGTGITAAGLMAQYDDTSPSAVTENRFGNVRMDAARILYSRQVPPDVDVTLHTNYAKKYYTSTGAVTDGIVWSPAAGKRWHVVSMHLNVSAAATVTLEDDLAAGDSVVWKAELAANSGETINFSELYPLASGEDAADLLVTTTAGNIYITLTGYEI